MYKGQAFQSHSVGGGIRFGYPIDEKETLSFGLAVDQTTIDITPVTVSTPPQYIKFQLEHGDSNITLPATVSWTKDTRNSAIYTTSGGIHRAGVELAVPGVDLTFYRLTYQYQQYFPLTRDLVLMVNAELGYANGLQGQSLPCLLYTSRCV